MDTDIEGLGDRFKHLTNLGEVLALVAPQVAVAESEVRTVQEEKAITFVQDAAQGIWGSLDARRPFQVMTQAGTVDEALGWLRYGHMPHVKLVDVSDVLRDGRVPLESAHPRQRDAGQPRHSGARHVNDSGRSRRGRGRLAVAHLQHDLPRPHPSSGKGRGPRGDKA